jgi:hypothetical protein
MRKKFGVENVIASDVRVPSIEEQREGPFVFCDVNDESRIENIVKSEKVKSLFSLKIRLLGLFTWLHFYLLLLKNISTLL